MLLALLGGFALGRRRSSSPKGKAAGATAPGADPMGLPGPDDARLTDKAKQKVRGAAEQPPAVRV